MTSAHLTSNSMLCGNTFVSQKTLQFSHKHLTLFTTTQESNQIVTLPTSWSIYGAWNGPRSSVSPLLLPRQHLSKTFLHLHLCCFWMFHAQTCRACSCVALLMSTKRTTSHFTSQECACKFTFYFHSQVTSLLSLSHSGRLATVARVSFVVQSSCSCELDTAIRCHTSCCAGHPLWAGFCSLRAQ